MYKNRCWLWCILIFGLCANTILIAQEQAPTAKALFDEGTTILNQTPTSTFDKIKALDKLLQSQKILDSKNNSAADFSAANKEQIIQLFDFFATHRNADSVLQLTRFFPDSIFQSNVIYDAPFKTLTQEYIDFKRNTVRTAFFKIKDLTFPSSFTSTDKQIERVTFENYWPLEVVELDQWVDKEEKELQGYSKKAKAELLFFRLKNELDSLKNQENTKANEHNKKRLLEKIKREIRKKRKDRTQN